MRKLLTVFALLFCLSTPLVMHAQAQETITVNKSDLSSDQVKALEAKAALEATQKKVDQYGKWVGVGHELGTAVNESLSAVTTNATAFANTSVGKWTIALVIWKVAGKDLAEILLGVVLFAIGFPIWIYSFYKNCITHRVLVKKDKDGNKQWELVNDTGRGSHIDLTGALWGHVACLAFGCLLITLEMFA